MTFLDVNSGLMDVLLESFFFVLERIIIEHATSILQFTNENEVLLYMDALKKNREIIVLQKYCDKRRDIYLKLKKIIFELFCLSFCNENVLKLCTVFSINNKD